MKLLLVHVADANFKSRNGAKVSLRSAQPRSLEIVKAFLDHGANVNDQKINGETALYFATQSKSPLILEKLSLVHLKRLKYFSNVVQISKL